MRSAILSLITAAALLTVTSTADARPFRHWRGSNGYNNGVRFFRSYNTSPYSRGYYNYRSWGYPSYYGGYGGYGYPGYYGYGGYYNPGFNLNFGQFGLSIGNGYGYPSYGGYWW